MPQGSPGPDDPHGPETVRRGPSGPGDPDFDRPTFETRYDQGFDHQPTASQVPSSGPDHAPADPFLTEVQTPSSGAGTGGSIVEGVVQLQAGQTVFGKYLVLQQLGRGGMGEVWLVKDVELDVKRALKMITQGTAFNADARARFRREARAMAQFSHPNVVTVHDSRLDLRDVAYIVMEYVPGESLEKLIQAGQPMPLDWTLRVLTQLCEALQEAHGRGIIHRDLKPSNLMMLPTASGKNLLKVLDFGIAKILGSEDTTHDVQTMVGAFMGTPPYASPEQASGHAEPLSDIYSAGVILYEFLTGYRPFRGKPAAVIANTLFTPPPPFAEANPEADVPPEVEAVVLRCLAKKPEDRPQSATALLQEFEAALATASRKIPGPPEPPPTRIVEGPRRGWLIGAIAASVVLGLVVASSLLQPRVTPVEPPSNPGAANTKGTTGPKKPLEPQVVREGWPFNLWDGRIYLPTGYQVFDPTDLEEGYPRTLVGPDGAHFLRIPSGQFKMGARGKPNRPETDADDTNVPSRDVAMPGFYIQKFEVTNGELLAYKPTPDQADPGAEMWRSHYEQVSAALNADIASRHPARQVPWKLASDFARRRGGRLPTEAQWEYAARSGQTSHALVWDEKKGRDLDIEQLANLDRTPQDGIYTFKGGDFQTDQTLQGVMDMAGNVREWCRDPFVPYSEMPASGPPALPEDPAPETLIVVRGGSFNLDFSYRFVTHRNAGLRLSDVPPKDVGFRVVIECPPSPAGN